MGEGDIGNVGLRTWASSLADFCFDVRSLLGFVPFSFNGGNIAHVCFAYQ